MSDQITEMVAEQPKRIIAVSRRNLGIKYSDDNGETWLYSNIRSGTFKKPIQFSSGVILCRCAEVGNQGILYTEDGGATWKPTTLGKGYYQEIIELSNGNLITTSSIEGGGAWISKDGRTWKRIKTLEENWTFMKSDELTVNNAQTYIGNLIEAFGGIKELIAKNNDNVHKMQAELMVLQKRTGLEITSKLTGGAKFEDFSEIDLENLVALTPESSVQTEEPKKKRRRGKKNDTSTSSGSEVDGSSEESDVGSEAEKQEDIPVEEESPAESTEIGSEEGTTTESEPEASAQTETTDNGEKIITDEGSDDTSDDATGSDESEDVRESEQTDESVSEEESGEGGTEVQQDTSTEDSPASAD